LDDGKGLQDSVVKRAGDVLAFASHCEAGLHVGEERGARCGASKPCSDPTPHATGESVEHRR